MQPLQTSALAGTVSSNLSIFDLFLQSDSIVKMVMLILLLASFWSWAVIFDKTLARRIDNRLKQAGQLPSKARFLAAPFIGMLEDGAYLRHAPHANAMAKKLAAAMPFPVAHPVEANTVFVTMDGPALERLHAAGWFVYRFLDGTVRFVCSWATSEAAVEELAEALRAVP